jgi:hypothetical protein
MLKVYVAAPFRLGLEVLRIHDMLTRLQVEPVSSWAYVAAAQRGNEDLHLRPVDEIRSIARVNDAAVLSADVVLAIVVPGAGREMYSECTRAELNGIPVLWHGEAAAFPLSAYRDGSERFVRLDDALDRIAELRTAHVIAMVAERRGAA